MSLVHLSSGNPPKCFIDCIAKAPVSTEVQSSWLDCSKSLKDMEIWLVRRGQAGGRLWYHSIIKWEPVHWVRLIWKTPVRLKGLTPAVKNELGFIFQWFGALRTPFLSSEQGWYHQHSFMHTGTSLSSICPLVAAVTSPAPDPPMEPRQAWCHWALVSWWPEGIFQWPSRGPQPTLSVPWSQKMVETAGERAGKIPRKCDLWGGWRS